MIINSSKVFYQITINFRIIICQNVANPNLIRMINNFMIKVPKNEKCN